MSIIDAHPPELLPVLSRGRHRNPRKGACFMELASFLAGERWSDHPVCTHPLLASLARLVNDYTTDAGRQRLAPLIPSVIGLTSDDLRVDARIALRAAAAALPVVAAERQNVMAASVITCDRILADLDGRPRDELEEISRTALAQTPHATRWAREFTRDMPVSHRAFRRHSAPRTVEFAVAGIARACAVDSNATLRALLAAAITDVASYAPPTPHPAPRSIHPPVRAT